MDAIGLSIVARAIRFLGLCIISAFKTNPTDYANAVGWVKSSDKEAA